MRIINEGDAIVRLLGREWRIRNADGSLHALVPRGSPNSKPTHSPNPNPTPSPNPKPNPNRNPNRNPNP